MKELLPKGDPRVAHLVIDDSSKICEVSESAEQLTGKKIQDIINKRISNFFKVIYPLDLSFLEPEFLINNQPCNSDYFIKTQHTSSPFEINAGLFQFSYSNWIDTKEGRFLIVTLSPQGFNSPITQWLMSHFHRNRQPLVLINENLRIRTYNTDFLSMLNYFDEFKLLGESIVTLLDTKYRDPNPFFNQEKITYIRSYGQQAGPAWKPAFSLFSQKGPVQSLERHFSLFQVTHSRPDPGIVSFAPSAPDVSSIMIYTKAVNFPNQDFKVEMTVSLEQGSDLSIALGRPVTGTPSTLYDHGYSFDLRYRDHLSCQLYRRSSHIATGHDTSVAAGAFFNLQFTRIGAHIAVWINGNIIVEYADMLPLFGVYTSHLHFNLWKQTMQVRALTISTRPSLFDMERISGESVLAFATDPERLYRFTAEPVWYVDTLMQAITFEHIPFHFQSKKKRAIAVVMAETKEYIRQNYFRKINFESMANGHGLGYVSFLHHFKRFYGITLKAYQMEMKMKEARLLLKTGRYSVQEVGEMVGMEDAPNFQHMFKRTFGTTPGAMVRTV